MTIRRVRATTLCIDNGRLLLIEIADPTTGKRMWSLPGGEIENGETAQQCATRETLEETGYTVSLLEQFSCVSDYLFRWNAKVYDCTTHWFIAMPLQIEPVVVDDADYLLGHCWIPVRRVSELFSYHPQIQQTIRSLMTEYLGTNTDQ